MHLVEPGADRWDDPLTNYHSIRSELDLYSTSLGQRPEIVVISKSELPSAADVCRRLSEDLHQDVLAISAVTGQGLNQLLYAIQRALDERRIAETKA